MPITASQNARRLLDILTRLIANQTINTAFDAVETHLPPFEQPLGDEEFCASATDVMLSGCAAKRAAKRKSCHVSFQDRGAEAGAA